MISETRAERRRFIVQAAPFLILDFVGVALVVTAIRTHDASNLHLNLTYARWAIGLTGATITSASSTAWLVRAMRRFAFPAIDMAAGTAVMGVAAAVCGVLSVQWPN
jgi:hypothetical protein